MKIKIHNLVIDISHNLPSLEGFYCDSDYSDVFITSAENPFCLQEENLVATHPDFSVYRHEEGWIYETVRGEQLFISADYNEGQLYAPVSSNMESQNIRVLLILRVAIECRLAREGVVSLHSACVEKDGKALSFTGKSGMGKSTRAQIWVKHLQANWISGDRPAISVSERNAIGVPWDGKEQIFQNVQYPLYAILDTRRSQSTSARRLTKTQKKRLLMQQCFLPMWDTETVMLIMMNIFKLIDKQPMYRLFCDRTEQAAEEVYEILFHSPEKIKKEAIDLKIKEGFTLKKIVGEFMVMPTGDNIAKFEGAVALNEVSAFIFEKLEAPIAEEDLLNLLIDEYEVDRETAQKDLTKLLDQFREYGMLDEEA